MSLFLDSSVAIAACLSSTGPSRVVFDLAPRLGWRLLVSPWVLREGRENMADKPAESLQAWVELQGKTIVEDDELTFHWPIAFEEAKDKPPLQQEERGAGRLK